MPRKNLLSASQAKNAQPRVKPYKLRDGGGLYLLVSPNGSKWWRWDYRRPVTGKRNTLSLGTYPEVPLSKARDRHDAGRALLASEVDPATKRESEKAAKADSFEAIAREWLNGRGELAKATRSKLEWMLSTHAYPYLGVRQASAITAPELLAVLRRLEAHNKLETAQRLKQVCGQIFRYAIATGRSERDPAADLRGALKTTKTNHHASITQPGKVGELMRVIDGFSGHNVTACALSLAPLVFVRPGELRQAEWSELDLDAALWKLPAEKMKARQPHIVPLSRQAVAILRELEPLTGTGRYVFPGIRSRARPMSENTINAALRRLGYSRDEMTGHGFRSMASTLLNEQGWPPDIIERQLAHAEGNKVRAAYNYAQHIPQRVEMMQAWADYLDALRRGADVLPFAHQA